MKLIDSLFQKERIDTTNWKEFKIGNLFEVSKTKDSSKILEKGEIPYVSRKEINNGVCGFKSVKPEMLEHNSISIHSEWKNSFVSFYHSEYCADGKIVKLSHSQLNKYNALFICTILNMTPAIDYKITTISNTIIKLPVTDNGSPDWEYMEQYVRYIYIYISNNIYKIIDSLFQKERIDTTNWKEFKIGNLFEVIRGKRIVKNRDYIEESDQDNIYPVITTKTTNNAIDGYYNKYNCEGNVICANGEVSGMLSTYQNSKCWVLDTSRILKPKFNDLNKYNALFLIPLLNKYNAMFDFINKAKPSDIENLIIKLPVIDNGSPDWEYMEQYIKSLPYSKYL